MSKAMTKSEVMKQLERQGDEKVRARYVRDGAGDKVYGVLMGKIRALAQTVGTNHPLGLELWATGNHEARLLACMILDPKALTEKEARGMLEPLAHPMLADELILRALVYSPIAETLQTRWVNRTDELMRRSGWRLLAERIAKRKVKDLDVGATLARIERELPSAPYVVKEGLNWCLCYIGVHLPEHTAEAIAVGERLGRWDTRPVSPGCTSSYPPEWIPAARALRKGEKTEARKAMEAKKASKAKAAPARAKTAARAR
jgi:3-methyladenine DNA glycosylase AlkD